MPTLWVDDKDLFAAHNQSCSCAQIPRASWLFLKVPLRTASLPAGGPSGAKVWLKRANPGPSSSLETSFRQFFSAR